MNRDELTRLTFCLHGISMEFRTNNPWIASAVNHLFRRFVSNSRRGPFPMTFSLLDRDESPPEWCIPPADATLYYSPGREDNLLISELGVDTLKVSGDRNGVRFFVDFGDMGRIAYRLDRTAAHGHIRLPERIHPKVLSGTVVMLVLSHLLAEKGYFLAHCGAVERHGKGILIPGFSGAGKTTACIAMVRKGFGFLGDDRPLIQSTPDGTLRLLAFPEDVDVTEKTITLFPELGREGLFEGQVSGRKKSFDAEEVYPGSLTDSCTPAVILYPERYPHKKSRIEEMPRSEALAAFMPHSMVVMDPKTTERHFDAIFNLVQSVDCYRLKFGAQVLDLPDLVESVL